MSSAGSPTALRTLGWVRVAVGGVWLGGLAAGRPSAGAALPRAGRVAAAVLAVRDIAQGALLVAEPRPSSAEAGAAIDVLHAASMVPVVAFAPRYRGAAATSAAVATAWAGAAAWVLQREGRLG
jgi:hypothetical protein